MFKHVHTNLQSDPQAGHPLSAKLEENDKRAKELISEDSKLNRDVADFLHLSKSTEYS